jgi:hypothetical protein
VQVAAAFEAAGRLVPARAKQQRLAQQAPGERLCTNCFGLLGERERAACVILDVVGQAVAVQVVLADAVVDVEHARDLSASLALGREPLDLELESLPPIPAQMRDNRECLLCGGDVVRIAVSLRELARLLRESLRRVEVAPVPGLVRSQARKPRQLDRLRRQFLRSFEMWLGRVRIVLH